MNRFVRLSTLVLAFIVTPWSKPVRVATVTYKQDTTALEGRFYAASHAKHRMPGIVLFPDWMGVSEVSDGYAKKISALGYAVFVADIYGKGIRPKDNGEAGKLSAVYKNDRALMRARAMAALETLKSQKGVDSSKIAGMGYCFGGTCALELARAGAPLLGVISVHGGLETPDTRDALKISGKVLVLHGADDPYVPAQQVVNFMDEMRQAKVDWQMVQYGGAVHSFTNPQAPRDPKMGAAYNPDADRRSYRAIEVFYKEVFGKKFDPE